MAVRSRFEVNGAPRAVRVAAWSKGLGAGETHRSTSTAASGRWFCPSGTDALLKSLCWNSEAASKTIVDCQLPIADWSVLIELLGFEFLNRQLAIGNID